MRACLTTPAAAGVRGSPERLTLKPMFDPSEPTEKELLAARDVPLDELRAKAKKRADEMGDDPFQDAAGLIMAVHAEKVYQYELQRRREAL